VLVMHAGTGYSGRIDARYPVIDDPGR